jgi:hypothetical protein
VLAHRTSKGGKSVFALRSHMSALDYQVDCPNTDSNDVAFVRATMMIRGHDTIEELLVCGLYPLSASFGEVLDTTSLVSKVVVSLPIFPVTPVATESANHFLAKVEMDAEKIVKSYGPKEHEACILAKLPNGGQLNQVFE